MNKTIKDRWTARLDSGEVEQIQGRLSDGKKGRCCLGVLCDIAVEDGVIHPPHWDEARETMYYSDSAAYLPAEVMDWAGLDTPYGVSFVDEDGYNTDLTDLNDIRDNSFVEIAEVIREKL